MKRIIGIKYTHDASVAMIEGDQLLHSIEMEKIDNRPRYSKMQNLDWVTDALSAEGITIDNNDSIVVDGWKYGRTDLPLQLAVEGYNDFEGGIKSQILQHTMRENVIVPR